MTQTLLLLAQSAVKNFTLQDSLYRLRTSVGVHYGSDMKQVRAVLEATATEISYRRQDRPPVVLMTEFGNSSVVFDVSIWVDDPWGTLSTRSALNEAIWLRTRDDTWEEVLARLADSHDRIRTVIAGYDDGALFEKRCWAWTGSTSVGSYAVSATTSHYDWAAKLIRRLVSRSKRG